MVNQSKNLSKFIYLSVFLIAIVLLFLHIKIIRFPYPLEFREGSTQLTTYAILNRINPYTIDNNPIYINHFGIGYNLVVLPFAKYFGNTLQIHRFINALFILGSILLLAVIMHYYKFNFLSIMIAGLFLWLGMIFQINPIARPDMMGEFLFLLCIFLPFIKKFSTYSLIFSALIGIFSFFTKTYFFLCVFIIASYMFLFISKLKALLYGLATILGLLATALVVNSHLNTYFFNTVHFLLYGGVPNDFFHLIKQTTKFLRDYWGLVLYSFIIINNLINNELIKNKINLNFSNINYPFVNFKVDLIAYCFIVSSLIVFLRLGGNTGTYQTYFYHLITPFFIIVTFRWINKSKYHNLLLFIALLTLISQSIENLTPDFQSFEDPDWHILEQYLLSSENILNSPIEIPILITQNKTIEYSGRTIFYFNYPRFKSYFWPDPDQLRRVGENYVSQAAKRITNGYYDLIVNIVNKNYGFFVGKLDPNISNEAFLMKYYHPIDTLTISMPHTWEEWHLEVLEPN